LTLRAADVPSTFPFEPYLLDEALPDVDVHFQLLRILQMIPGVPGSDRFSAQWQGAMQARVYGNIWDGVDLVYYWPPDMGPLPLNESALHPGLSAALSSEAPDGLGNNYTVRLRSEQRDDLINRIVNTVLRAFWKLAPRRRDCHGQVGQPRAQRGVMTSV
jgi:hypothetical protein